MSAPSGLCDAHVHLWPSETWNPELVVVPGFDAGADVFLAAMDANDVRRAAVVTPGAMGWDNGYTLHACRSAPERLVAVGRLDVGAPGSEARLEREIAAGLRGVRIGPALEPEAVLAPAACAAWELLAASRLPVHAHLQPDELSQLQPLLERYPDVPLVIDHLGRPDVAAGVQAPAFRRVLDLAGQPQVRLKTPASAWFSRAGHPYRDLEPFLAAAVGAFGARRILWGSDWPGCTQHGSYADAAEPLRSHCEFLSEDERRLMLAENFTDLYGEMR